MKMLFALLFVASVTVCAPALAAPVDAAQAPVPGLTGIFMDSSSFIYFLTFPGLSTVPGTPSVIEVSSFDEITDPIGDIDPIKKKKKSDKKRRTKRRPRGGGSDD